MALTIPYRCLRKPPRMSRIHQSLMFGLWQASDKAWVSLRQRRTHDLCKALRAALVRMVAQRSLLRRPADRFALAWTGNQPADLVDALFHRSVRHDLLVWLKQLRDILLPVREQASARSRRFEQPHVGSEADRGIRVQVQRHFGRRDTVQHVEAEFAFPHPGLELRAYRHGRPFAPIESAMDVWHTADDRLGNPQSLESAHAGPCADSRGRGQLVHAVVFVARRVDLERHTGVDQALQKARRSSMERRRSDDRTEESQIGPIVTASDRHCVFVPWSSGALSGAKTQ